MFQTPACVRGSDSTVTQTNLGKEAGAPQAIHVIEILEAAIGIEPMNKGFADLCLTTWLRRLTFKEEPVYRPTMGDFPSED